MDTLIKIGLSLLGFVVALIPVWVFIGLWYIIAPAVFWEKFAMIALGLVVGGGFQVFLLILCIPWLIAIWE